MTPLSRQLTALTLMLLGSTPALAEEERWYRIELLIFANQSEAATPSEAWEPTPVLNYPATGRFLVDRAAVAANAARYPGTSEVDPLGHQTITIPPPVAPLDTGTVSPTDNLPAPAAMEPDSPEAAPGAEAQTAPEELVEPVTPTPFVLLPRSELEFHDQANNMQRTGRYHILFHESWVQPVADQGNAVPIIIDHSGDTQSWPRLQGSVRFHLSRYLHLETNLWLNTDGSYLPDYWQMPAPPLGPKSLTVITPPEAELEPVAELEAAERGDYGLDTTMDGSDTPTEEVAPLGPEYPWRHAVLLKQKRRMRSTEVHYIDHPLLGLVVKISPLTEEELQQQAEAEAANLQAEASTI